MQSFVLRNRTFLDGLDGLAGSAVQHVDVAIGGDNGKAFTRLSIHHSIVEDHGCAEIRFSNIVVRGLKVTFHSTDFDVERYSGIRIEIVATPNFPAVLRNRIANAEINHT